MTGLEMVKNKQMLARYRKWVTDPATTEFIGIVKDEIVPILPSADMLKEAVVGAQLNANTCGAHWALRRLVNLDVVPVTKEPKAGYKGGKDEQEE